MHLISMLGFAIASNLDNLIIGLAYGAKKIRINNIINIIISLILTAGTALSMAAGDVICRYIPEKYCALAGSVLLILLGVQMIIKFFRPNKKNVRKSASYIDYNEIITSDITKDKDNSGNIDLKEAVSLAASLSLNNVAIGVSAAIAGASIWIFSLMIFVISVAFLASGLIIGKKYISAVLGHYAPVISASVIILLGIIEMFW